jgi:hypothetical protein
VEGFELEALKAAANLLSHRPVLIMHPLQLKLSDASEAEILHLLEGFGYDVIDRNPISFYSIIAGASSPH